MHETLALSVRAVSIAYPDPGGPGRVSILRNVSLGVAPGRFHAVVGPSGSGKSTLLHCAAGLEVPDSGHIALDGVAITDMSRAGRTAYRRDHVGFVFQDYNLIGSLTVRDNILLPSRLRGQKVSQSAADGVLDFVGLARRGSHRPRQLSGGEQQRAAIARVLVSRPRIVFADEPTGALDVSATETVLSSLRSLPREGCAVVMVTHDPHAAALADTVLVMSGGHIVGSFPGGDAERISRAILRAQQDASC